MAGKPPQKPRKTKSLKKGPAQPTTSITPIEHAPRGAEAIDRKLQAVELEIQEQIRIRAYELFIERGRHEGHDREDWERAETEVLSKYQREKSA